MGYAESIIIGRLTVDGTTSVQHTSHFYSREAMFVGWRNLSKDGFPSVSSVVSSEPVHVLKTMEKGVLEKGPDNKYHYENRYLARSNPTIICLVLPKRFTPVAFKISPSISDISKCEENLLLVWIVTIERGMFENSFVIRECDSDEFEEFSVVRFMKRVSRTQKIREIVNRVAGQFSLLGLGR